jgi:hypothetical protein
MTFNQAVFAGAEISKGRKPVTFAALDRELNIVALETWSMPRFLSCLSDYEKILLALTSGMQSPVSGDFKSQLTESGLKSLSGEADPRRFVETDAQDCFRVLISGELLPRRTLEGRIQRSLILFEEGFQIRDPMDFFEEITRHKLLQGILPREYLYSSRELNALLVAYVAWMVINRPHLIERLPKNFVLPKAV